MLEKIINIKPALSYKGGRKAGSSFEKFLNKPFVQTAFGSDSLVFSPAAIFLSKINWHLKEIDTSEIEKLKLNFYIEDIEFETNIDISEIYNDNKRKFKVSKEFEVPQEKKRAEFIVTLNKEEIIITEDHLNENLEGTNKFLERIFEADFSFTLDSSEKYLINDLLTGIDEKMLEELKYIDAALLSFINKLEKFPPIKNHYYENIQESLVIDQIKIYRD